MIIHKAKIALLVAALVVALSLVFLREQIQQLTTVSPQINNESPISPTQDKHPEYVCNDTFEQDTNDLAFAQLEDVQLVDCVVTGCGGLF